MIKLQAKRFDLNFLLKFSDLKSNFTLTLGYLNPVLNNRGLFMLYKNISVMKTCLWKNISIPARTKNIKALTSILLWAKTTPLMYAFMKYFTLDSGSLHSIPGKNVVNSHTLYFSILFYRPFLSAFSGPLSGDSPPLEPCVPFTVYFYSFHT